MAISVVEPTSPEVINNDINEGKISLNLKPGVKTLLKLKISNSNPIENQTADNDGQKLGLVIKSIEFLRYDPHFQLTGKKSILFRLKRIFANLSSSASLNILKF